jgi:hypothetical protein
MCCDLLKASVAERVGRIKPTISKENCLNNTTYHERHTRVLRKRSYQGTYGSLTRATLSLGTCWRRCGSRVECTRYGLRTALANGAWKLRSLERALCLKNRRVKARMVEVLLLDCESRPANSELVIFDAFQGVTLLVSGFEMVC